MVFALCQYCVIVVFAYFQVCIQCCFPQVRNRLLLHNNQVNLMKIIKIISLKIVFDKFENIGFLVFHFRPFYRIFEVVCGYSLDS